MIAAHSRRADYELKSKFVFAKSHGCSENSPNYRRHLVSTKHIVADKEGNLHELNEEEYEHYLKTEHPDLYKRFGPGLFNGKSAKEEAEVEFKTQLSKQEIKARDMLADAAKARIKQLESKPKLSEEEEYDLAIAYDELNANRIRPEAREYSKQIGEWIVDPKSGEETTLREKNSFGATEGKAKPYSNLEDQKEFHRARKRTLGEYASQMNEEYPRQPKIFSDMEKEIAAKHSLTIEYPKKAEPYSVGKWGLDETLFLPEDFNGRDPRITTILEDEIPTSVRFLNKDNEITSSHGFIEKKDGKAEMIQYG